MTDSDARLVRAAYTEAMVTVYQAYSPQIAVAAVRAMMHRSGNPPSAHAAGGAR